MNFYNVSAGPAALRLALSVSGKEVIIPQLSLFITPTIERQRGWNF